MKASDTDKAPVFNLLKPDGVRPQANIENITHVFLTNGLTYEINPGTFHFYVTSEERGKGVPFVQFDSGDYRIEVFPASVAGISYKVPEDD